MNEALTKQSHTCENITRFRSNIPFISRERFRRNHRIVLFNTRIVHIKRLSEIIQQPKLKWLNKAHIIAHIMIPFGHASTPRFQRIYHYFLLNMKMLHTLVQHHKRQLITKPTSMDMRVIIITTILITTPLITTPLIHCFIFLIRWLTISMRIFCCINIIIIIISGPCQYCYKY